MSTPPISIRSNQSQYIAQKPLQLPRDESDELLNSSPIEHPGKYNEKSVFLSNMCLVDDEELFDPPPLSPSSPIRDLSISSISSSSKESSPQLSDSSISSSSKELGPQLSDEEGQEGEGFSKSSPIKNSNDFFFPGEAEIFHDYLSRMHLKG